jgi:hypothetical protein
MLLRKKRKKRRISLQQIPLKKGYDRSGKYWGEGRDALYLARDMDTGQGSIFRASDRSEAIKKIGVELGNDILMKPLKNR